MDGWVGGPTRSRALMSPWPQRFFEHLVEMSWKLYPDPLHCELLG